MKNLSVRFLAVLALMLLSSGSTARAEFVDWAYHWSITPAPVLSSGTGSVALALAADGAGASTIPVAKITTTSAATTTPDSYNVGYNLALHLTDKPSGQSGDLMFHGSIVGTVTATSAKLTNSFSDPTASLKLGGRTYSVTLSPTLLTLTAPGSTIVPQVNALVSVTTAQDGQTGGNGGVQDAPEPSTVILASLGIPLIGFAGAWRRSRRAAIGG